MENFIENSYEDFEDDSMQSSSIDTFSQIDIENVKSMTLSAKHQLEEELQNTVELYPLKYWEEGVGNEKTEYINIDLTSEEFKEVNELFSKKQCIEKPHAVLFCGFGDNVTCSKSHMKIIKLERIQNYAFLERFSLKYIMIKHKYDKLKHISIPITKTMFHGVGTVGPKVVLESEEGLDQRYSSNNYYGFGTYFADYADHCDGRYTTNIDISPTVMHRQVIMAEVIVGLSCFGKEGQTKLGRHPAIFMNPNSEKHVGVKCDSFTNDKDELYQIMNVVTENSMCYPKYIITYEVTVTP